MLLPCTKVRSRLVFMGLDSYGIASFGVLRIHDVT